MERRKIESGDGLARRFARLRAQLRDGIKWWAEHQSWPATDEIRIDRHHRGCC